MKSKSLTSLLLAAGTSSRFGSENKLLKKLGGVPMCAHVLHTLIQSSTDNILVVTGYQHELVKSTLCTHCSLSESDRRVQFVHNPLYEAGMGSTIATGVSKATNADAILVCLADMPGISSEVVNALHSAWKSQSEFEAYLPEFNGRTGNPVLLHSRLFSKLLTLNGDSGARQIIKEHQENVLNVQVNSDSILKDFDRQSDLL